MDPDAWTRVISSADLIEEELTPVELDGQPVLLFRMGERVFAVGGRCTHAGMPLAGAPVDLSDTDAVITCQAHGSRFRLDDGRVVRPPAQAPLPRYEARVVDDGVQIRATA